MALAGRISHRALIGVLAAGALAIALAGSEGAGAQGSCLGSPATISGTPGDDLLAGTPGDDVIDALGGDDVIAAGDGNDLVCAGLGIDVAQGGNGNDRIEGGTEDDLLVGDHLSTTEVGAGDDEVAGGEGDDVVIGDVANEVGSAAGEGDDKVNGGAGTDVVIGDAYSSVIAAGTGDDDVDAGPGSDVVSGDVIVGDPTETGPTRGGGAGAIEPGVPIGVGAGGDEVNTQTGDDVVVGDALSFSVTSGARSTQRIFGFSYLAELFCGARLAGQVIRKLNLGMDPEEIKDFVEDTLKAEFDEDFVVGDCANIRRLRSQAEIDEARRRRGVTGGGPDDIKSGNEGPGLNSETPGSAPSGDVVADSVGWGKAGSEPDLFHLGKGNDVGYGDGAGLEFDDLGRLLFHRSTVTIFAIERDQPIPPTSDFNADGVVDAADYTVWRNAFGAEVSTTPFGGRRAGRGAGAGIPPITGGGKDTIRGAGDADYIEGGPKKDRCKGGGGDEDRVKTKGAGACEKTSGVP